MYNCCDIEMQAHYNFSIDRKSNIGTIEALQLCFTYHCETLHPNSPVACMQESTCDITS